MVCLETGGMAEHDGWMDVLQTLRVPILGCLGFEGALCGRLLFLREEGRRFLW